MKKVILSGLEWIISFCLGIYLVIFFGLLNEWAGWGIGLSDPQLWLVVFVSTIVMSPIGEIIVEKLDK
jgi:hypothetical protein